MDFLFLPNFRTFLPEQLEELVTATHLIVERHRAVDEIMKDAGVNVDEVGDVRMTRFGEQISAGDFEVVGGQKIFDVRRHVVFVVVVRARSHLMVIYTWKELHLHDVNNYTHMM